MPDSFIHRLPQINAICNATATLFIIAGLLAIFRGHKELHKRCMAAALLASAVFLTFYLIYHAHAGSVKFTETGWPRPVYFTILISHLILAIVNLPMVIGTVVYAVRGNLEKHKKWARRTYPIWLYVSITGVLVYFMLYVWWPPQEVLQRKLAAEQKSS